MLIYHYYINSSFRTLADSFVRTEITTSGGISVRTYVKSSGERSSGECYVNHHWDDAPQWIQKSLE